MSFDLGVWYGDATVTPQDAAAYYSHLNTDRVVVRRNPEFDAFWTELLARFPDRRPASAPPANPDEPSEAMLTTFEDLRAHASGSSPRMAALVVDPVPEDSPWAATLAPEGSAVALPIGSDHVQETVPVVYALAARHGLIVYDPQSGEVALPPSLQDGTLSRTKQPLLVLQISGRPPTLDVKISLDLNMLVDAVMPSRREAHLRARALALRNGLSFYDVDDPRSLTQSMRFTPGPMQAPSWHDTLPPAAMPPILPWPPRPDHED